MNAPFYGDAAVVTGRQIYSGTYKGEPFNDRHCGLRNDGWLASDHGRFVLVSSSQAQSPEGTNAAYAAAKAAAESWTLALADSFKDTAATANIIVVNAILTPRMREESPDKSFGSFTSAEQIAEAIAFVCSDAAAKMNGKRLSLHP